MSAVPAAAWWAGLGLAGLVYLALTLVEEARFVLGRLASERVTEETGLAAPLDPGSRSWLAVETSRLVGLLGFALLAARLRGGSTGTALVAGIGLLIGGRILETIVVPGHPERVLRAGMPLVRVIDLLLGPPFAPLAALAERLVAAHRRERGEVDEEAREEQIEEYIRDAEEEGLLEREQGELLREIVDAGDIIVREVMTPRTEIVAVPADATLEEVIREFIRSRHSRLPVHEGSLDRIVGVAWVRDLLPHVVAGTTGRTARDVMRPVLLVPGTKKVLELLREMQAERQQLAIVIDEYGGTAGLVTLEDLVEEIVGEIHDEHERGDEEIRTLPDGSVLVDGLVPIEEFEERLGIDLPEADVETVGGLVFARLGRVPRVGDRVEVLPGLTLEVARLRGRRIAAVRVRRAGEESSRRQEGEVADGAAEPAPGQGGSA